MRPSQLTQQLNRAKSTNLVKPSETVNLKDKNQIT